MKKKVVFLLGLLILFILASSVQAVVVFDNIQATLLSQEPDPVKPGETVEVRFKIENDAPATSEEVLVEILPEFPFSLYSGSSVINLGKLRAGQTGSDAAIVRYTLKVDEEAVEGDTGIGLRIKVGDQAWKSYTDDEFIISVESPDAILSIGGVYTDPSFIVPGQDAKLYVKLKNEADNVLRNIKLKLDLSGDDLPIVPIDNSDEMSLYQITSGEDEWVIFGLAAKPDAEAGLYKVPVELTYFDLAGNEYSQDSTIGARIGDEPELLLYVSERNFYTEGEKGTVTITLANPGLANIKLLTMTLMPSENYEIISTNSVYLGDVDSDDIESQDFEIYISQGKDVIDLPVKLEYRDANNKKIEETYQIPLKLYSGWEARKFGLKSSGWLIWLTILVILGAAGYFLYRKYWHKKKKKP